MRTAPVLLVHGFASSFERNWREPGWVDLLADAGRSVIEVDLLGHGNADKPHDPAAYADLESGVADVLPAEGEVDAIGFSLGARVLLGLASRMPERFGRLVAGGVGTNLLTAGDHEPVARAIEGLEEPTHPLAQAFSRFAQTPGNDPKALAAVMRRPEEPLTAEVLAKVTCPVLLVIGDKDFAGPPEPLAELLPNVKVTMLRGVDHLGTPGDFGFIDAALGFIEAVPA